MSATVGDSIQETNTPEVCIQSDLFAISNEVCNPDARDIEPSSCDRLLAKIKCNYMKNIYRKPILNTNASPDSVADHLLWQFKLKFEPIVKLVLLTSTFCNHSGQRISDIPVPPDQTQPVEHCFADRSHVTMKTSDSVQTAPVKRSIGIATRNKKRILSTIPFRKMHPNTRVQTMCTEEMAATKVDTQSAKIDSISGNKSSCNLVDRRVVAMSNLLYQDVNIKKGDLVKRKVKRFERQAKFGSRQRPKHLKYKHKSPLSQWRSNLMQKSTRQYCSTSKRTLGTSLSARTSDEHPNSSHEPIKFDIDVNQRSVQTAVHTSQQRDEPPVESNYCINSSILSMNEGSSVLCDRDRTIDERVILKQESMPDDVYLTMQMMLSSMENSSQPSIDDSSEKVIMNDDSHSCLVDWQNKYSENQLDYFLSKSFKDDEHHKNESVDDTSPSSQSRRNTIKTRTKTRVGYTAHDGRRRLLAMTSAKHDELTKCAKRRGRPPKKSVDSTLKKKPEVQRKCRQKQDTTKSCKAKSNTQEETLTTETELDSINNITCSVNVRPPVEIGGTSGVSSDTTMTQVEDVDNNPPQTSIDAKIDDSKHVDLVDDDLPVILPPKRRKKKRMNTPQKAPVTELTESARIAYDFPRHNWLENKINQLDSGATGSEKRPSCTPSVTSPKQVRTTSTDWKPLIGTHIVPPTANVPEVASEKNIVVEGDKDSTKHEQRKDEVNDNVTAARDDVTCCESRDVERDPVNVSSRDRKQEDGVTTSCDPSRINDKPTGIVYPSAKYSAISSSCTASKCTATAQIPLSVTVGSETAVSTAAQHMMPQQVSEDKCSAAQNMTVCFGRSSAGESQQNEGSTAKITCDKDHAISLVVRKDVDCKSHDVATALELKIRKSPTPMDLSMRQNTCRLSDSGQCNAQFTIKNDDAILKQHFEKELLEIERLAIEKEHERRMLLKRKAAIVDRMQKIQESNRSMGAVVKSEIADMRRSSSSSNATQATYNVGFSAAPIAAHTKSTATHMTRRPPPAHTRQHYRDCAKSSPIIGHLVTPEPEVQQYGYQYDTRSTVKTGPSMTDSNFEKMIGMVIPTTTTDEMPTCKAHNSPPVLNNTTPQGHRINNPRILQNESLYGKASEFRVSGQQDVAKQFAVFHTTSVPSHQNVNRAASQQVLDNATKHSATRINEHHMRPRMPLLVRIPTGDANSTRQSMHGATSKRSTVSFPKFNDTFINSPQTYSVENTQRNTTRQHLQNECSMELSDVHHYKGQHAKINQSIDSQFSPRMQQTTNDHNKPSPDAVRYNDFKTRAMNVGPAASSLLSLGSQVRSQPQIPARPMSLTSPSPNIYRQSNQLPHYRPAMPLQSQSAQTLLQPISNRSQHPNANAAQQQLTPRQSPIPKNVSTPRDGVTHVRSETEKQTRPNQQYLTRSPHSNTPRYFEDVGSRYPAPKTAHLPSQSPSHNSSQGSTIFPSPSRHVNQVGPGRVEADHATKLRHQYSPDVSLQYQTSGGQPTQTSRFGQTAQRPPMNFRERLLQQSSGFHPGLHYDVPEKTSNYIAMQTVLPGQVQSSSQQQVHSAHISHQNSRSGLSVQRQPEIPQQRWQLKQMTPRFPTNETKRNLDYSQHHVASLQNDMTAKIGMQHDKNNANATRQRPLELMNFIANRQQTRKPNCSNCNKSSLFLCSGCKMEWYCSEFCQTRAWDRHSESCMAVTPRIYN